MTNEKKYKKIEELFKQNNIQSTTDIWENIYDERSFIEAIWQIILE